MRVDSVHKDWTSVWNPEIIFEGDYFDLIFLQPSKVISDLE